MQNKTKQYLFIYRLDNIAAVPTAYVTFNNGRTEYMFDQKDVKLNEVQKSTYGTYDIYLFFI